MEQGNRNAAIRWTVLLVFFDLFCLSPWLQDGWKGMRILSHAAFIGARFDSAIGDGRGGGQRAREPERVASTTAVVDEEVALQQDLP